MSDESANAVSSEPNDLSPRSERTDVETIRHLVRLMHRFDLTAIDLVDGPMQIRLRRRSHESASAPVATPAPMPLSAPTVVANAVEAQATSTTEPEVEQIHITSPMVGTFYSSSDPQSEPFVRVGSMVRHDTVVCIIEAMKVFTEIPAGGGVSAHAIPPGQSFRIAEVLVTNGQAVEFGQPLFRVEPS